MLNSINVTVVQKWDSFSFHAKYNAFYFSLGVKCDWTSFCEIHILVHKTDPGQYLVPGKHVNGQVSQL